uniref:Uncharacterized protein n=1 Tax=Arundo donax TaxID=35708 RepID=A0A0A9CV40_ARUDO
MFCFSISLPVDFGAVMLSNIMSKHLQIKCVTNLTPSQTKVRHLSILGLARLGPQHKQTTAQ